MSTTLWIAAVIAGLLPYVAIGQENSARPSPTDPLATTIPPVHESAFKTYRPLKEPEHPPAAAWRAANDEMARLAGHAGHIRDSGPHHGHGGHEGK